MFHVPHLTAAIAAGIAIMLSGCGSRHDRPLQVDMIGAPAALFQADGQPEGPARLLRSATAEGLVGFDEQGRVIPALADRWIVTDDGQSYIFRVRDGSWADGTPLTAEAVHAALVAAIAKQRSDALGLDLDVIDEARAMAGRVIEIRLKRPFPYMLQLLAQPELGLLHKGQGVGPMRLRREQDVAVLSPIPPGERGMAEGEDWASRYRGVDLRAVPAVTALKRFDAGQADVVLGGRLADLPRLDVAGLSRGAIRLDPVAGLFGLAFVHADGLFSDPANREAISMAIDRDGIVRGFGVGGWVATTRLVTPGLETDPGTVGERWATLPLDARRAEAARRIARWRAAGHQPARIRIALPPGPGCDELFAYLAADFKAIGLDSRRVGMSDLADLRLIDAVARYPMSLWFLNQLNCRARAGLCDSAADALVARALEGPDAATRADRLADAEAALTRANVFVPIAPPLRWSLVSGDVSAFVPNRWNVHPLLELAPRSR
jgi:peptide/nickel transport system substrate-binding protein/oligopeptide transport system substrate-binding protein